MPRQKRWSIKRSLTQSELAVVKAQNYLILVGKQYNGIHPEYFEAFSNIVTALELVKNAIFNLNEII